VRRREFQRKEEEARQREEDRKRRAAEERARRMREIQERFDRLRETNDVLLTGFLTVQAGNTVVWRRRYFQLMGDRMTLHKNAEVCCVSSSILYTETDFPIRKPIGFWRTSILMALSKLSRNGSKDMTNFGPSHTLGPLNSRTTRRGNSTPTLRRTKTCSSACSHKYLNHQPGDQSSPPHEPSSAQSLSAARTYPPWII
jgi:hypothetical protein